ncbi:MAG: hypothetical protein H7A25_09050 [Leptospiraceae bacterium]|nr:hypothetical protein [Leptospiraceae bacterium]MCP5500037.1 hypothetical protein [Leptospiraceae bacterium]
MVFLQRTKLILSAFLSFILLAYSFITIDSLMAFHLESSLVCRCNHSSPGEKHSVQKIPGGIRAGTFSEPKKFKNCHTAKQGEVHTCSCKKEKREYLILLKQFAPIQTLTSFFVIQSETLYIYKHKQYFVSEEIKKETFRPPRTII